MSTELVKKTETVTIQELYKQPELTLEQDRLITFLNQEPPAAWVKVHPYISGHKYLPIEKVEFMLKRFFKTYSIKVIESKQLLNSIMCSVTVRYQDPVTGIMVEHDGVGACELQTAKDTGPLKLDASNINKGAVPMALGIAKSIAVKDACDHIGNIFGANLNRKDVLPITADTNLEGVVNKKEHERMLKLIDKAKTRAELDELRTHLTTTLNEAFEGKWNITNE